MACQAQWRAFQCGYTAPWMDRQDSNLYIRRSKRRWLPLPTIQWSTPPDATPEPPPPTGGARFTPELGATTPGFEPGHTSFRDSPPTN